MHLNYSFLTQIGLRVTHYRIILIKTNNRALFFSIYVLASLHQATIFVFLNFNQFADVVHCKRTLQMQAKVDAYWPPSLETLTGRGEMSSTSTSEISSSE